MKIHLISLAGIILFSALTRVAATTYYVDANNPAPLAPYTNWPTSATNIQDAIDAASDGDLVLVTNGVYKTGGRVVYGSLTNRVVINKTVTVQSMNGSAMTVIQGNRPIGNSAVRCVYLTNNATLIGFTLTNGATRNTGILDYEQCGGGAYGESTNSTLINCLVVSNTAAWYGGGIRGNLGNGMQGFGDNGGSLLISCTLLHNSAGQIGGGSHFSTLKNCILFENSVSVSGSGYGGGSSGSILINCTICSNSPSGIYDGTLKNCVIYYNGQHNHIACLLTNSCTIPLASGVDNFTNAPIFINMAGGDFHLSSNSPCINAGNNSFVATSTDLGGNLRIVGGTVDIGAYEFQSPSSVLSYAWAQQYGLPTDGSADFVDSDGDGMNNWQEWVAGIIPTNAASVLRLNPPAGNETGLNVSWQSVNTRTYYLQRSTNMLASSAFTAIQSNLAGDAGTTIFTDTSATNGGPYFYRVGVQQ